MNIFGRLSIFNFLKIAEISFIERNSPSFNTSKNGRFIAFGIWPDFKFFRVSAINPQNRPSDLASTKIASFDFMFSKILKAFFRRFGLNFALKSPSDSTRF